MQSLVKSAAIVYDPPAASQGFPSRGGSAEGGGEVERVPQQLRGYDTSSERLRRPPFAVADGPLCRCAAFPPLGGGITSSGSLGISA